MFKNYVQKKLETYVKKYLAAHPEIKLVAVAGSVGKTTTKLFTATLLSQKYRVRVEDTNHNTGLSAPVAILGIEYPDKVHSPIEWLRVFSAARKRIKQPGDVDIIVQELGTDRIGEVPHFGTYLRPTIGIVTAVAPEHMEFFGSIETVAQEELALSNYSELALINRDDIDGRFASFLTNQSIDTYGTTNVAEYRFEISDFTLAEGYKGTLVVPEFQEQVSASVTVYGEHMLRPVMAAVAVAAKLGMSASEVAQALQVIKPVAGRMNVLRGVDDSTIIDDTYNSSPSAAEAALQTLYGVQAPQRIAILGSMNELGTSSAEAHKTLGSLCDPGLLAWVITIGQEAEQYLAPAARARGCQVKSFRNALEAGAFAHQVLETGAVVLAKGSQGNVYAEEAVKILLHETHEDHELVRQSETWMATKSAYFSQFS